MEAQQKYNYLDTSFEQVYLNHYDKVFSAAYRYLKQKERAEDLTQSIFLKLFNEWEKLEIQDIDKYLFTTAKHAVLNELQHLVVQKKYITFLKERFSEGSADIENLVVNRQLQNFLYKAISRLPERQQQAFRLSRDKGLTYKEIAVIMNISRASVNELIGKAISSIKQLQQTLSFSIWPLFLLWLL